MSQSSGEAQLGSEIYTPPQISYVFLFLACLACTVIFFVLNFPVEKKIKTLISPHLERLARGSCPVSIGNFELGFLTTSLKNVKVGGLCFKRPGQDLTLSSIDIHQWGPSLIHLGWKFDIETILKGQPLLLRAIVSPSNAILRMEETGNRVSLKSLALFNPQLEKVDGDINLNFLLDSNIKTQQINDLNFSITSNNIKTKPFTGLLRVPALDINNLLLQGKMGPDKLLRLQKFTLGDEKAAIQADMDGSIKINERNPNNSQLDLKGRFSLNDQALKKLIPSFLLLRFEKQDNNFYAFKITGTPRSPNIGKP